MLTFILGFAAMQLVGATAIRAMDKGAIWLYRYSPRSSAASRSSALSRRYRLQRFLAVVSGLLITGATAVAHDLYGTVVRKGRSTQRETLLVARVSTVLLALVAIVLGLVLRGQNVAFLVGLATAVAAAANFRRSFWRSTGSATRLRELCAACWSASWQACYLSISRQPSRWMC